MHGNRRGGSALADRTSAPVAALLSAAPAPAAAAPTPVVGRGPQITIDGSLARPFDVAGERSFGFIARTTFPDGRL